ncbi:ABC transporter permease [archaeon]|nr:ABC transporter permease [archaeon]
MIKTIPLVQASVKEFVRNWKSIFLLIVCPLILISIIFTSFNAEGIQKIPLGLIMKTPDFRLNDFRSVTKEFIILKEYNSLDDCFAELKAGREYACIEVIKELSFFLNINFDNTKGAVIWEVLARLKNTVDNLQKEETKNVAKGVLTRLKTTLEDLERLHNELITANNQLDNYIFKTDQTITELRTLKSELSTTLQSMRNDIQELKNSKSTAEQEKNELYQEIKSKDYKNTANRISSIGLQTGTPELTQISNELLGLENLIERYNQQVNDYFVKFDNRIYQYEQTNEKGYAYTTQIDSKVQELENVKNELVTYKTKINLLQNKLDNARNDLKGVERLDPEVLVNPVIIKNQPTYEGDARSRNLVILQTVFPTLLLLVVLFLSLLISSFITLRNVNSSASKRVMLIKGIFVHDFLSGYISSLFITSIPMLCVLLLGKYVFKIDLFSNFVLVFLILFLLSSIFLMLGMIIANVIKKESIALLLTTFILIILIFFSGLLLPIEKMSDTAALFAINFPGKITIDALNQVIFYGQGFQTITSGLVSLLIWFSGLTIIALAVKKIRDI